MTTPQNPKQEGSGVCDAIPQVGPCPNSCNQCCYNRHGAFYAPIDRPLLPTIKEVAGRIVRVNSGHDSNSRRKHVIAVTSQYRYRFYNTSRFRLDFGAPVVLTVNPREEEPAANPVRVVAGNDGNQDWLHDIMFVRVRVSSSNLHHVEEAVKMWTARCVPVVLTFMAYFDATAIPTGGSDLYVHKVRTLNEYWCPTPDFMRRVIGMFWDNPLVHSCGTPESTLCRNCGNCERMYWQAIDRARAMSRPWAIQTPNGVHHNAPRQSGR